MRFKSILVLLISATVLFSTHANAADIADLKTLFKSTFRVHYETRKCGENMGRFIRNAVEDGIDLRGAKLLKMKSPDFWELRVFSARNEVGNARMFYFHYVLYADGWVFDYDFTDQPKVVKFENYLDEMFVPRGPTGLPQFDYRKSMRESFELTFYDAIEFEQNGSNTRGIREENIYLRDFIDLEAFLSRVGSRR